MKNTSKGENGYNVIVDTYNKNQYPIIENKFNAFVFPWDMKRNIDYIDPTKFYNNSTPK
ncbi:hypothetical protein GOQ29_13630 [Clostridium sp. D2Q-14]|uniref:hypothetical protein n=1 Tax=Anaeromonas gelatinilytica TaxID=2683194 RepID=UPI00193C8245|nr:hypothetical protein [Anaeromonas gelatinilytica]MBS4536659.1 hypothetical protein [Anaeromonas gelatinilytica]